MILGVPKEIKDNEMRVGLLPSGAEECIRRGHTVLVEHGAGVGSGFPDEEYARSGAKIVATAAEVFGSAEMVVKVKEPQPQEIRMLLCGQILFTYLHLAASRELTDALLASGVVGIAYETIRLTSGELPLLTPMSEIAGRMAVQKGANYLEGPNGGRGVLLGGVPGVAPGHVVILGGGVVGSNAARIAAGLGAAVYLLDVNLSRLRYLADVMPANVTTLMSNPANVRRHIQHADLLIGAVLSPGAKAPTLVTRDLLKTMQPGAVIVDVAVDQGGCVETVRPTTHSNPTFTVDGIVHYCVANMPGAVPRTSTYALTNATLPYILSIAGKGWRRAAQDDRAIAEGVNLVDGALANRPVAETFGMKTKDPLG